MLIYNDHDHIMKWQDNDNYPYQRHNKIQENYCVSFFPYKLRDSTNFISLSTLSILTKHLWINKNVLKWIPAKSINHTLIISLK